MVDSVPFHKKKKKENEFEEPEHKVLLTISVPIRGNCRNMDTSES
jgi:hypothetical protein